MVDEYISREAAKVKIREKFKTLKDRIEINEVLNSIPAAEVQPVRQGRWQYETETEMFQCSVCGGMAVRNEYPYCHWCGAKVDKEET